MAPIDRQPGDRKLHSAVQQLGSALPTITLAIVSEWPGARIAAVTEARKMLHEADEALVRAQTEIEDG